MNKNFTQKTSGVYLAIKAIISNPGYFLRAKPRRFRGSYFENFTYQKKLFKALLVNVFGSEYAKRFRLSATSTTQKALLGLIESGIVEKVNSNYSSLNF